MVGQEAQRDVGEDHQSPSRRACTMTAQRLTRSSRRSNVAGMSGGDGVEGAGFSHAGAQARRLTAEPGAAGGRYMVGSTLPAAGRDWHYNCSAKRMIDLNYAPAPPMDPSEIYAKTELGLAELRERKLNLPITLRGLLILIDGNRTVARSAREGARAQAGRAAR